jgi:hypothetical protein
MPKKLAVGARKAAMAGKRSTSKRELIETGTNSMYGKRTAKGQFKEMDDAGKSLSVDRRRAAKTTTEPGFGDRGDRKRTSHDR